MKAPKVTGAYSLMQAAEWGVDGCLYCYSSVFLLSCGLSNTSIGVALAVAAGLSVVGQILFGEYLNRRGRGSLRRFLLAAGGLLLLENGALLLPVPRLAAALIFLAACTLLNLFPAFMNTASMYELQRGVPVDYGIGRGCGSLGYAACSAMVGRLLLRFGNPSIFVSGAALSLALICGIVWFFAAAGSHTPPTEAPSPAPVRRGEKKLRLNFLTAYPRYAVLLVGCMLLMMGHTYTSNFLYQIISSKGGNEASTGVAAAIAACTEVPVLFLFGRFRRHLRSDQLLKLSAALLTLKMLLGYLAAGASAFLLSELLQCGYALFTVSSVYYTGLVIPHRDLISGQAYLNAATVLGSLLSLLSGGVILDHLGVSALLLTGVGALVTGAVITFCFARPEPARPSGQSPSVS